MLDLYHNNMSVCSQKVRLCMAEKGVDFESHVLDLRGGDQFKPEFQKLNPKSVVPVIVHDGNIVTESNVIDEYVDEAFQGPDLKPKEALARAHMRLWAKRLDDGMHFNVGALSFCVAFRHQLLQRLGSKEAVDAHIARIQVPAAKQLQTEALTLGLEAPLLASGMKAWAKTIQEMDAALAETGWLVGKTYSLADIAFAPYAVRIDQLQLSWLWDKCRHVAKWYDAIKSRPAFDTAVTKWLAAPAVELMEKTGKEGAAKLRAMVD